MSHLIEIAVISDSNDQLHSLAVWDMKNGTNLMKYKGGGAVSKHSFIKNNFIVGANNVKPLLSIWPVNSTDPIQNIKFVLPARANSLAVSPDGCFLVAGVQENVFIWQISTGKMLTKLSKHYQPINEIKFVDDGSHFVTAGQDGMVLVWNLSDCVGDSFRMEPNSPLYSFSDHALPVTDIWIGKGGMRATLCSVSLDRTCKLYDLSSGQLQLSIVFQEMLTAVVVDSVEIGIFVGTSLGNIYQFQMQPPPRSKEYHLTDENKINSKFAGHTKSITTLAISLDQQTLMSGSEDFNVMTWNIQSKSLLKTILHKGAILSAKYFLTPSAMFEPETKLELITRNFQRMVDTNETDEEESIDILVHDNLYEQLNSLNSSNHAPTINAGRTITTGDDELNKLKAEVERLKKVNNELYQFSVKNLIEK